MSKITTHVLDTVLGKPATGIVVLLERQDPDQDQVRWTAIAQAETDADGRCQSLAPEAAAGLYRLTFQTGPYFARQARQSIYPKISITFRCAGETHYHLPLLLSDNSYTTYRGS